jgi:Mn2+/Fe2+ NRAMP family transporter
MFGRLRDAVRLSGPGLVWAAAAIGSGEVVIGTKVGAEHGYSFLWALWLGLLLKWAIHRGVLDLTVRSGRSVVDLWHDLRLGRLISCYWLVFFLLTITGLSGLLGLTAASLHEAFSVIGTSVWAVIVAAAVAAFIYFQRSQGFEMIMLIMCLLLVIGVIGSVILARPAPLDLVRDSSLPTSVSAGLLLLSLMGWGAGSGPDLILPYSTWVLEKGRTDWEEHLPTTAPATSTSTTMLERTRQAPRILRIGRIDLASGYVVTGFVASGFMIAGGALLAPRHLTLTNADVIPTLSTILTGSYGQWAFVIFITGAIAAFLSTFAGVLDGTYVTGHRLVSRLRGVEAEVVADRGRTLPRALSLAVLSLIPLLLLLAVEQPVTLVIISGLVSAVSMPVLGTLVLYSLIRSTAEEHQPSRVYLGAIAVATFLYLVLMVISIVQLW